MIELEGRAYQAHHHVARARLELVICAPSYGRLKIEMLGDTAALRPPDGFRRPGKLDGTEAEAFLESAARLAKRLASRVEIFDPVPARMARKAGFDRAQLLVRAKSRAALQPFLREWKSALDAKAERRVRWTLDVDPQEL